MNTLFSKVLGENEKCVFYFYLKIKGTFWPAQSLEEGGVEQTGPASAAATRRTAADSKERSGHGRKARLSFLY